MRAHIVVEELDEPVDDIQQEPKDAEQAVDDNVSFRSTLGLGNRAQLPQHLYKRDNKRSQRDTPERICHRPPESTPCDILWHAVLGVRVKVPRAIDSRDRGVQNIFDELADPVHGKSDEDNESNHFSLGAAAAVESTGRIVRRGRVLCVNSNESDGEPCSKAERYSSTNCGSDEDMAMLPGNMND